MGNCTSSKTQVHEYGFHDNSWHVEADVDDNRNHKKVGCMQSQQGAKGLNQDAAILYEGYGMKDGTLCAVFDGHGRLGHKVSKFIRNQLPSLLLDQRKSMKWNEAFVSTFEAMDEEIKLHEDVDFINSGTTALVAIKQGDDVVIANLGDSRAVLGTLTENGIEATQLTVDLKPDLPAEAERIKICNGLVYALKHQPDVQRVWSPEEDGPCLAMSRTFGDFDMKSYGVIATPEISHHRVTTKDQFIVLASDGVWDALSNEEVVSVVWATKNKESAAKAVVYEARTAWKRKFPSTRVDDCTVVCLFLQER
ncbi:hypothetical protein BVRB_2g033200 [Beta vulgaris subsp. vulgaris]|uniref:PPM-type phosphatase domain-containing protein n=1 Tax=Beta vulgaris subsp. vulgaris TaxID=3555 RepID=A0A0J8D0X9_BETVV|nr:hypothetical protein BVRB_2g033200 [Beta vulgaris subsp. vulgaris]